MFSAGVALLGLGLVISGISLELPPFTLDGVIRWMTVGDGWWVWLVAGGLLALYIVRGSLQRKQIKVPPPPSSIPSAQLYTPSPVPEVESVEEEKAREREWERRLNPQEPEPLRQSMPETPRVVVDPSMERVSRAFDTARERMIDEFADAVSRMDFKITLPERQGETIKIETKDPAPPLPTTDES